METKELSAPPSVTHENDVTDRNGRKSFRFNNVTDVTDRNPRIRETWGERAAIMEFDGGLSREEAELQALNDPFVKDLLDADAAFPDSGPEGEA